MLNILALLSFYRQYSLGVNECNFNILLKDKMMMKMFIYLTLFLTVISSFSVWAGKKRCKPLLEKLHNIQGQQRTGYSVNKGMSLQAKADKAREKWWQCENKINQPSKKNTKAQDKSKKATQTKSSIIVSNKTIKPFATSKPIVMKSRFQGEKQQAWLNYYQEHKPDKCKRPKSTQTFAFCMEDKAKKAAEFSTSYGK
jgi:hypothetical protein